MTAVVTILLIFSGSYMFRGIFTLTKDDITDSVVLHQYAGMLEYLIINQFCDFCPVMLILVFHFRNFKVSYTESESSVNTRMRRLNSEYSGKTSNMIHSSGD